MEKLLDVAEVANLLGLHELTVRNMVRDGSIKGVQIGRKWKFQPMIIKGIIEEGVQLKKTVSLEV